MSSERETAHANETLWPAVESQMRPWTRWWWLGNAVDEHNLTLLMETYHQAGLGGVEITPIYGVQGQEARDIDYLSPRWMEMLRHTIAEARRLGMGVDMSTGTGWPFGGPNVTDADAADKLVIEKTPLVGGSPYVWPAGAPRPQALMAVLPGQPSISLLERLDSEGRLTWTPPPGAWTLYCVTQKWAGRTVKRASPGGAGKCINPFSRQSLTHYLERFDDALAGLPQGALRCEFHDSFEYLADWEPSLFVEFAARRGYDLRDYLPALAGDADADQNARVKTDYRETLAELLRESFTQTWTDWAHAKGSLSRNQAHGSPGNLLDLYGTVDIPETEIFGGKGDPRANKFASSAAHVMGRRLTSSESCTWLAEHFTVSLDMAKRALDSLLAAGINHIFYHGTAYSPQDAEWPGWLFYASTTFTPSDPLWHDFPALNHYITRCQSVLQSGEPDNDILVYWPLHDLWQTKPGAYMLEINGKWLTEEPIGQTAQTLWDKGYAFDYVSDHQISLATVENDRIRVPGGDYRVVVVPPCTYMPDTTLAALLALARAGATVIFENDIPAEVPGLGDLEARRRHFQSLRAQITLSGPLEMRQARLGAGRIVVGSNLQALLEKNGMPREVTTDSSGFMTIRRRHADGHSYFIANHGTDDFAGWAKLAAPFHSAMLMDAMTGQTGKAAVRQAEAGEVYLQIPVGASLFVRTWTTKDVSGAAWTYAVPAGQATPLAGPWTVSFVEGGPELPALWQPNELASWTAQGEQAARFAGTARYRTEFDAPAGDADGWLLTLGRVCESARVRLNGQEMGTLIAAPFQVMLGHLKSSGNVLEVDVTNLAANRIRDMDRRHLPWKVFREINFVDIRYKPFDASNWPVRDSGLLGPVQIVPQRLKEIPT